MLNLKLRAKTLASCAGAIGITLATAAALLAQPANAGVTAALVTNDAVFDTYVFNPIGTNSSSAPVIDLSLSSSVFHGIRIDTLSALSPTDIRFKNGLVLSGWGNSAQVTTGVAVTFTNDQSFAVTPVLKSTLLAAGIGSFLTHDLVDPYSASSTSCSTAHLGNCTQSDGSIEFPGYDIASPYGPVAAGFAFDVSVGGTSIYNLHGDTGIAWDTGGNRNFYSNFNGADTVLSGFHADTALGDPRALAYSWDDTPVDIVFPDLLQPGDSVTAIYTVTTWASLAGASCIQYSSNSTSTDTNCMVAYASFGDPIRSGGVIGSNLTAAGAQLGASGLIGGLTTQGYGVFQLPTGVFDPITHTLTAALDGHTVQPDAEEGPGGPPSVVPEPASWALMIGGFGMIGGALRRRRVVAA